MHPYLLIDDGEHHDLATTPGVFIIVTNGSVYVRDDAQVIALGEDASVRLAGTAHAVAYHGAQIQQEGAASVATAYGASSVISMAGQAHLFGESTLVFVEGGNTDAWLHNTATASLFAPHPGAIHLYDMTSLTATQPQHLAAIRTLLIPSAGASLWVDTRQYAVIGGQPVPVDDDAATADSEQTPTASATPTAIDEVAPTLSYVTPAPADPDPVFAGADLGPVPRFGAGIADPPFATADRPAGPPAGLPASDTPRPSGATYPDGAPEGLELFDDFDVSLLRFSDWDDMQPWSRSPWFEITPTSGPRVSSSIPVVDIPAQTPTFTGAGTYGTPTGTLGTIDLPTATAPRHGRFIPPGM